MSIVGETTPDHVSLAVGIHKAFAHPGLGSTVVAHGLQGGVQLAYKLFSLHGKQEIVKVEDVPKRIRGFTTNRRSHEHRSSEERPPANIYEALSREHPLVADAIPSNRCSHCEFVGDARWVRRCSECSELYCRDWCLNLHWKEHRPKTSQAIIDSNLQRREKRQWSTTIVDERKCYDVNVDRTVKVTCELYSLDGLPQPLEYKIDDDGPGGLGNLRSMSIDDLPGTTIQDVPHCHRCRPRKRIVFRFNRTDSSWARTERITLRDWKRLLFGAEQDQFEWFLEDLTQVHEHERAIEQLYFTELAERWMTGSGEMTLHRLRKLRLRIRAWLRRGFYLSVLAQGVVGAFAGAGEVSPWLIFIPLPFEILFLVLLEFPRFNTDHEHFDDYQKGLPHQHRWRKSY